MNSKRLIDRFLRYITVDSESGNEAAFCRLIEEELRGLGLEVLRDEVGALCGSDGWNVYASLQGEGTPILFSAHMDTVSPGKGIRPMIGEDGVIRSSGDTILGSDDKSGIAAVMEALEVIREKQLSHRPIEVLFTVCEEVGLLGSRYADYSHIRSKEAVVLDSSCVGGIVNRAAANMVLHIRVEGRSAHAGVSPEKGIHALKAAAAAVAEIPCGRVDDMTVMNVANFLAPGKSNVVPAEVTFDVEIRSFEEERLQQRMEELKATLDRACALVGASYTIEQDRHSDVLYVAEDTPLVQRLTEAFRAQGVEASVMGSFGGSDATWIFANGIDAVNVGTGMSAVHGTGEYIRIEDLEQTARVVLAMTEP